MSLTPRLTMIGLYNYDNRLFDALHLPDAINEEDFINNFLLKYGECPVIYPNWGTMQFAIGAWSKKWYHSIERIIYAMTEDYNPLHNFDRHEEYADTEGKETTNAESVSTTGSITNDTTTRTLNLTDSTDRTETIDNTVTNSANGSTENTVSAFNEDDYQPDTKSDSTNEQTNITDGENSLSGTDRHTGTDTSVRNAATAGSESRSGSGTEDRTLSHTGHLYGNIGVTESTQMLLHEVELRKNYNIIDIVADMLYREVCVYVY